MKKPIDVYNEKRAEGWSDSAALLEAARQPSQPEEDDHGHCPHAQEPPCRYCDAEPV